jgi:glycosyltransferase involved in cell wall biosynthesis
MMAKTGSRICLVPHLSGLGGMVSFQQKLAKGLVQRGVKVVYDLSETPYAAVLITGGYKNLAGLGRARREGVRIVQRLDGMNWLHRRRRTGAGHFLKAEYGNLLLAFIRARLADHIVYQSLFSQQWWERVRGSTPVSSQVVYNGVDLEIFNPQGNSSRPSDYYRLLLVEANLAGGYEMGLETAVNLGDALLTLMNKPVGLTIAGRVPDQLQGYWHRQARVSLEFTGQIPHERIPELDRSAHLLYSADLNAACPNSVIEAMACGLPVAAFDTGALPELVTAGAGQVVPYGGDPWKLEPPDVSTLAQAAAQILNDQERCRASARARAEAFFGLDQMVNSYLEALLA